LSAAEAVMADGTGRMNRSSKQKIRSSSSQQQ